MSILSAPLVQLLLLRTPGIGVCSRQTICNRGRDSGVGDLSTVPMLYSDTGTLITEVQVSMTGSPSGKLKAPAEDHQ